MKSLHIECRIREIVDICLFVGISHAYPHGTSRGRAQLHLSDFGRPRSSDQTNGEEPGRSAEDAGSKMVKKKGRTLYATEKKENGFNR